MAVSKRLRYEILRRDDHACRYCGAQAPDVQLTVDHVTPITLGGSDDPTNLVTACRDCNAGKSSVNPDAPVVDNVADDALRWARALETVAEIQAAKAADRDSFAVGFESEWDRWTVRDEPVWKPEDWRISILKFHDLGLTGRDLCAALDDTMPRTTLRGYDSRWRYFCGICWGMLRERQELAQQLIDAGEVD